MNDLESQLASTGSNESKEDRLLELACENNDLFLCGFLDDIKDEGFFLKTICAAQIGLNMKDQTPCNILSDQAQQQICVNVVSERCTNDDAICTELNFEEE